MRLKSESELNPTETIQLSDIQSRLALLPTSAKVTALINPSAWGVSFPKEEITPYLSQLELAGEDYRNYARARAWASVPDDLRFLLNLVARLTSQPDE